MDEIPKKRLINGEMVLLIKNRVMFLKVWDVGDDFGLPGKSLREAYTPGSAIRKVILVADSTSW